MKRTFGSCGILFLGLAAINIASAQETNGLEGIWYAQRITPVDCQTGLVIPMHQSSAACICSVMTAR